MTKLQRFRAQGILKKCLKKMAFLAKTRVRLKWLDQVYHALLSLSPRPLEAELTFSTTSFVSTSPGHLCQMMQSYADLCEVLPRAQESVNGHSDPPNLLFATRLKIYPCFVTLLFSSIKGHLGNVQKCSNRNCSKQPLRIRCSKKKKSNKCHALVPSPPYLLLLH